ncbi:FAD-dependent monooxygenase [Nocardiopsis flavescens]|uniref:2-polyprenyl-6-methoxyphenol hydroxylase n=1 Tax=Nocardiopsis flavescens TaxID=758803 RepID=A0A1M6TVS2_9ACTN|nr:FAD-dependent monooxygenase [Nocardiopsis flavescens]SHK61029.1 2-polyprenyl-6-methoxyphenol hydroxylase [Nocardiopsis flavescens]
MTAVHDVLISGAGVAGPALAHWLHHHGIRATVVERAPAPRPGGYAVDLRGVAVDVAERMGALAEIRRGVTGMGRASFVDSRGRRVAGFSSADALGGDRSLEILRGDLVRILHTPTEAYTEYLYDDTLTALEQDGDRVRATFERTAPRTFDLVVGADGLHSATRRIAFGPEERYARFLGAHISIFTIPDHLGLDREARLFNAPGRGSGMYRTPRAEGAKAIFIVRSAGAGGIDRRPPAEQRAYLRAEFGGLGWENDRILDAMDASGDFYFDSVTRIHMDTWSRGRITLLGDAGYCPSPMSGQGTSLALVGAYVLAAELARHGRAEDALAAYGARMRPYVDANQAVADAGLAVLAPRTRRGIVLRNTALRLGGPLVGLLGRLDRRLSDAAEGLDLDAPAPARP